MSILLKFLACFFLLPEIPKSMVVPAFIAAAVLGFFFLGPISFFFLIFLFPVPAWAKVIVFLLVGLFFLVAIGINAG